MSMFLAGPARAGLDFKAVRARPVQEKIRFSISGPVRFFFSKTGPVPSGPGLVFVFFVAYEVFGFFGESSRALGGMPLFLP